MAARAAKRGSGSPRNRSDRYRRHGQIVSGSYGAADAGGRGAVCTGLARFGVGGETGGEGARCSGSATTGTSTVGGGGIVIVGAGMGASVSVTALVATVRACVWAIQNPPSTSPTTAHVAAAAASSHPRDRRGSPKKASSSA